MLISFYRFFCIVLVCLTVLCPATIQAVECEICLDELSDSQGKLSCSNGHVICEGCVQNSSVDLAGQPFGLELLVTQGLTCPHTTLVRGGRAQPCGELHSFTELRPLLNEDQRDRFERQIELSSRDRESPALSVPAVSESNFERLRGQIEAAFVFYCPVGCGVPVFDHDGCYAVQCSNLKCNNQFCMACLKSFGRYGSVPCHLHASKHGGSGFDYRSDEVGLPQRWRFLKRYRWVMVRERLEEIFEDPEALVLRGALLNSLEPILKDFDRMMWPFPVGQSTASWVEQVLADDRLTTPMKIWLLQNERVFQKKRARLRCSLSGCLDRILNFFGNPLGIDMDASEETQLLSQALLTLGGDVMAHLDGPPRDHHLAPVRQIEPEDVDVLPVLPQRFLALGNPHRVGFRIWSGVGPKVDYISAKHFCTKLGRGSRLPSKMDYIALSRALGSRQPDLDRADYDVSGYRPDRMPQMRGKSFHIRGRPEDYDRFEQAFIGSSGSIVLSNKTKRSVRCVWDF